MIVTQRAIVVEGRYDRERVSRVTDALIVTTDGFNIRKDIEKQRLIKRLAAECGLVILTDSDDAGFQIRRFVEDIAGRENVVHAYIPDVKGRERRKSRPSSAGQLGVEGVEAALVAQALEDALKSGVNENAFTPQTGDPVTAADLYADGMNGSPDAARKRARFLRLAGLPERLSTKAMLAVVNHLLGRRGYDEIVAKLCKTEYSSSEPLIK